jgi:hypothetical protein
MYENHWIAEELKNSAIRDKRLVKRLIKTGALLAEHPHCSISQACSDWADAKAAYRLFDNEKMSPEAIIMSHKLQTIERIKGHQVILGVQDTTTLDYTHHPHTAGIGLLSHSKHMKGILVHSSLAVTTDGRPLGLLYQNFWIRDPEEAGKRYLRKELPIEEKESNKWLEAMDASLQGIPDDTMVVTVCDREADIYDLFHKAVSEGKHLLVRASKDRRVVDEHKHLFAQIQNSPVAGEIIVDVPKNTQRKRPTRKVRLSIQFCPATIKPPKYRSHDKTLPNLTLYSVLAQEVDPPEGIEPIQWFLLTTLPVTTPEEAVEKVHWYTQRWKIERYHLTLKSGCKVEELQLETLERLQNALALYSVIAWRILWITYEARETPDAPCTVVLKDHEWQSLYCMVHKISVPPKTPPTLREAVLLIAKLGGFLGRKGDGEPGVIVLWRGMARLNDISEIWSIMHPST